MGQTKKRINLSHNVEYELRFNGAQTWPKVEHILCRD